MYKKSKVILINEHWNFMFNNNSLNVHYQFVIHYFTPVDWQVSRRQVVTCFWHISIHHLFSADHLQSDHLRQILTQCVNRVIPQSYQQGHYTVHTTERHSHHEQNKSPTNLLTQTHSGHSCSLMQYDPSDYIDIQPTSHHTRDFTHLNAK